MSIWILNQSKKEIAQVRERLGLTPYQFSTVEDMKLSTALNNGDICITFGEEVAGDSLVKVFKVVEDENAVPEGAIESHQLADDKWVYILTILREADKSAVFLRQTSPPLVSTALNAPVILSYKFGALTPGTATVKYYVNSMLKFTEIIIPGEHSFDISPFLTVPGTHVVDVVVSNAQGGSASLSYSINIVELSLRSIFDSSTAYTGDISFRYTPYGAVEKTIHFILDGVELETSKVTSSGVQQIKIIDALDHGAHILEVFATAVIGGSEVRSNLLKYLIVAYEAENETIIIGSMFDITETVQGTVLNIPYRVYNPASETTDIELYIDEGQVASLSVDRGLHYWNIANYPVGMITFSIVADEVIKSFVVSVAESEYYVEAITEDLDLYLTAAGRSNSEAETRDEWVYGETVGTLTDFNWLSNGWILDNEEMVLRVSGEARVNIPYKLFAGDPGSSGLTLEIEFKSRLVEDLDTVLLSCFSGNIGFKITPQMVLLATELMNENSDSAFTTLFKEDEKIRVSFVVEPRISNKLIFLYINGVCSGVVQYDSTDNFTQSNPVGISIGSNEASIDIYTIRKYSSALSAQHVLDNYIADTYSISERARLILKNDIFDAYSNVDYNKVVNTIPCLTVIGPLPSVKGDKKTVSIIYENRQDPTKNISFIEGATIDIQGTSSQYYPRKNYKLKLPEPYQLKDYSKPEKTFCFKADYMESSHAYNTGNARLFNEMMKLVSKIPPQEIDDTIRTTIDGYPCVIFYRASMESPLECFGAYNFNLDKSSYSSFGHVGDSVECWEFCDNSAPRCNFLTWDDQRDVFDDFEARYPKDYENTSNLERVVSWVASFAPGAVNEGNITKFKSEIGDYWDLDSLLAYYCIVMVGGMIDSLAKNLFIESFDGEIWYPIFYDMDTCYGLNNEGVLGFDYGIEFQDPHGSGHVWNGHQSVLWNILEEAFPSEIQAIYRELRNNYGLTYDNLIDMFVNEQIGKIPEALYNYDNDFKYLQPLYNDGIGTYLYIAQGTREHHLKWWLKNRFVYMDSKYMGSGYVADYATMRLYTPTGDLAVEPDGEFILTSAVDQYLTIKFGAEVVAIRAKKDVPTEITPISQYFNDTETIIYGASNIKDFGELANKYAGTVDMSNATRVSRLIIGSSETGYKNSNLRNLSLGNNIMLKELNVENCENLGGALNLSGCVNIEEVYAQGTTITSVALPTGGNLKKMELPATITNITIRNHAHINTLVIPANSNLTALRIENCTGIPIETIINGATNLARIRLTGLDITTSDDTLLQKLRGYAGIDEFGNNIEDAVIAGKWHLTEVGENSLLQLQEAFPELTITYTTLIEEYVVRFVNWDGTVLDVQYVREGQAAVNPITRQINPIPTPLKESIPQYSYTFSSWSGTYSAVYSDRTITATFSQTVRSYQVRFMNGETVLESKMIKYGSSATFTGVYPTPLEGYVFGGWNPSPLNIIGPTDCLATFDALVPPDEPKDFEDYTWAELKALVNIGHVGYTEEGTKVWSEDHPTESITLYNDTTINTNLPIVYALKVSPDGTKLAMLTGNSGPTLITGRLEIHAINGTNLSLISKSSDYYISAMNRRVSLEWLSNSVILTAGFSGLLLWSSTGSKTTVASGAHFQIIKISKDENYVAIGGYYYYSSDDFSGGLKVFSRNETTLTEIASFNNTHLSGMEFTDDNRLIVGRTRVNGNIALEIYEVTPEGVTLLSQSETGSNNTIDEWEGFMLSADGTKLYATYVVGSTRVAKCWTLSGNTLTVGNSPIDQVRYYNFLFKSPDGKFFIKNEGASNPDASGKAILYGLKGSEIIYNKELNLVTGFWRVFDVSFTESKIFIGTDYGVHILDSTIEPLQVPWFGVGDVKTIQNTDGESIELQVFDIAVNKISGTDNKAMLTLGSKNPGDVGLSTMNPDYNNIGGWHSSAMRAYLNSTFISKIPAELMLLLESVDIITSEGNQSSMLITDSDKIFLPAMKEVGLINGQVSALENDALTSLAIFTTNASRAKTSRWWTRSPVINSAGSFFAIMTGGTATSNGASNSLSSIFCCCL